MKTRTMLPAGLFLAATLFLGGCISIPFHASFRGPNMDLETLIPAEKFWTANKVLLVGLDGVLTDDPGSGGLFSDISSLVALKDALKRAEEDPTISSVLLRVNSPGGSVTASDLIYTELARFKARTGKKIVAVCMDMAASGGYYAALAGDRIFAHPTSVTGSIGVVAVFPSFHELGRKIGLDVRVIKSGDLKDMGSMWRDLEPREREIFQNVINSLHERFLQVVAEGRPGLSPETIRGLADGRIYTAQEALNLGLVDKVGYIEDAFETAKALGGVQDASLVTYTYPFGYRGNYYASSPHTTPRASSSPAPATQINLLNLDLGGYPTPFRGPFYYLWTP